MTLTDTQHLKCKKIWLSFIEFGSIGSSCWLISLTMHTVLKKPWHLFSSWRGWFVSDWVHPQSNGLSFPALYGVRII